MKARSSKRRLKSTNKAPAAFGSKVERAEHSVAGNVDRVRYFDRLLADNEKPLPGAHIISPRRGYLHHGIYVGDGRVVHYAGLAYGLLLIHGVVEEVSVAKFARGRNVWVRWRQTPAFGPAEIIRRARSRVGEDRYRILHNNCEHFCEWCVHGKSRSYQVERLLSSQRVLALILRWCSAAPDALLPPAVSSLPAAAEREKYGDLISCELGV